MSTLTALVKRGLLEGGHYRRKLRWDRLPGVAVLCYHAVRSDHAPRGSMVFEGLHVRESELEAHCRFVRESCHPIRLSDWLDGATELPHRPVLMSFDDGYESVFRLAKPILEKYEIPAVVFVTSRPAIERRCFWYDQMGKSLGELAVEDAKGLSYDEWSRKLERLPEQNLPEDDPHAPLTLDQIRILARHPLFEIGGHTSNHPILARASVEVQWSEIEGNKRELENLIGVPLRAFAYPNGRPDVDFTEQTTQLVENAGYEIAFTARYGFAQLSESRWERSRFLMLQGISEAELAHRFAYSFRRAAHCT